MATTNGRRMQQPKRDEQKVDWIDRQPPFDLQAELGVLGSIMLLPSVCDEVQPVVRAEDFYDDAHACLFGHMMALHAGNRAFDMVLLVDRMKSAGDFEKIGGIKYLSKVVNAVATPAHAVFYAEIVREKALYRSLILEGAGIVKAAYDEAGTGPELIAQAEAALGRLSDATVLANDIHCLREVVFSAIDDLDDRMTSGGTRLLRTGFNCMDDVMSLVPGGVTIIAGRASMGKSAFAINIACNVARRGERVFIQSLEMSAQELAERMLSSRARVPQNRMVRGQITGDERSRIVEVASDISQLPLLIKDDRTATLAQIAASIRREQRRAPIACAIIDYAQLVQPDNPRDSRNDQLDRIARQLKIIAGQLQIPLIALVQVNRDVTSNADLRPRLHQLKGTGGWEEHSDAVVFVHRPKYYLYETGELPEPHEEGTGEDAEIIVAKNRNGPTWAHAVLWFKHTATWANRAGPQHIDAAQEQDRFQ